MFQFLLRRSLQGFLTLWVVSVMAFSLTYVAGSPVGSLLPADATAADAERLTAVLGLDRPLYVQYLRFVERAATGDFGESIKWQGESAMGLVFDRLPATLALAGTALLFSVVLAVPIGVFAAVRKDRLADRLAKIVALLGMSLPPFWLGIMLIWAFGVGLQWLPVAGAGQWQHLVLPAIALGWYQVAAIMRLTRSAMLDVLDGEYIKLARMKGVSEMRVVWVHALRNALLVPLTYFGIIVGAVITRTVVIEVVFGWPGTGTLVMEAVLGRDFPVVNAMLIVFASVFLLANFLVDVLYAVIDPRIRLA